MTLGYSQKLGDGSPTYFKEKILLGTPSSLFNLNVLYPKLHSIRHDVHDRWRPGMDIHHVYGNRTKERNCFLVNKCVWVQRISIFDSANVVEDKRGNEEVDHEILRKVVMVDGRVMSWEKCIEIAHNDGFDSLAHFYAWFNKDFSGRIIIWDKKLRY